jgi:hypothetical protein
MESLTTFYFPGNATTWDIYCDGLLFRAAKNVLGDDLISIHDEDPTAHDHTVLVMKRGKILNTSIKPKPLQNYNLL